MRMSSLLVAATLLVTATGTAMAETSAGTVLRFDDNLHMMTLNSGETFVLPGQGLAENVTAGDYVMVGWSQVGGERVATSIYAPNETKGY